MIWVILTIIGCLISGWFGNRLYNDLRTPKHRHTWEVVYFDAPWTQVIRKGTCDPSMAEELFGDWPSIRSRTTTPNHPETRINSYFEELPSVQKTRIYGLKCGCGEIKACDAITAQEYQRYHGEYDDALLELQKALSTPDGSLFSYPVQEVGQKT